MKLLGHFRNVPLAQIDQSAIDRAAKVLYPAAAPSTVNRQVYTPMAAILHHSAERGHCEFRKIRRPRQPRGRMRWLTPEEADRLIGACSPHMARLITFMFYTGARVSEALYLDWRQVDLSRRQLWFEETKNGDRRGVPLHPRVVAALANSNHREGAVFRTHIDEPYRRRDDNGGGQIKTGFNAACRRAGIENFTPHDCRHTWATWHYAANHDLGELMELGGWRSEAMVMRYAHVNTEHLKAGIDRLPGGAESVQSEAGAA